MNQKKRTLNHFNHQDKTKEKKQEEQKEKNQEDLKKWIFFDEIKRGGLFVFFLV